MDQRFWWIVPVTFILEIVEFSLAGAHSSLDITNHRYHHPARNSAVVGFVSPHQLLHLHSPSATTKILTRVDSSGYHPNQHSEHYRGRNSKQSRIFPQFPLLTDFIHSADRDAKNVSEFHRADNKSREVQGADEQLEKPKQLSRSISPGSQSQPFLKRMAETTRGERKLLGELSRDDDIANRTGERVELKRQSPLKTIKDVVLYSVNRNYAEPRTALMIMGAVTAIQLGLAGTVVFGVVGAITMGIMGLMLAVKLMFTGMVLMVG